MDNDLSELKLNEMIRKINSSLESLDTLTDLVLKASSQLDTLIKAQYEMNEASEGKKSGKKSGGNT